MAKLESKIPSGPLADKWRKHKAEIKLVNPANKRKYHVVVVGAGLAGRGDPSFVFERAVTVDLTRAGDVDAHLVRISLCPYVPSKHGMHRA